MDFKLVIDVKPDQNKKRVIVDYKNITTELLQLLTETYPYGYEDETIMFTNAKGERVEAVQLETDDAKYLIKVSAQLDKKVEVHLEQDDDFDDDNDLDSDVPEGDDDFDDD